MDGDVPVDAPAANLTITEQQAYARTRIEELEEIAASVQDTEKRAAS